MCAINKWTSTRDNLPRPVCTSSLEIVHPPGTRVIQLLRDRRDMFRLRYEGKD